MSRRRDTVIERGIETFFYVAGRYATTSKDLAKRLGITSRQALRYLFALERKSPVIVTQEACRGGLMYVFRYSPEWRKQHGFLRKDGRINTK